MNTSLNNDTPLKIQHSPSRSDNLRIDYIHNTLTITASSCDFGSMSRQEILQWTYDFIKSDLESNLNKGCIGDNIST